MNVSLLERELTAHLDSVPVPAGDLVAVVGQARRTQHRRWAVAAGMAGVLALTGGLVGYLISRGPDDRIDDIAPLGRLNLDDGLRGYADPGVTVHLGDRTVPYRDYDWLDTDAAATPSGILFFTATHRPLLLGADGRSSALVDEPPATAPRGWHPSSAFDAQQPLVAWTEPAEDGVLVRVFDLDRRVTVADQLIPCSGEQCDGVRVDGLDQGLVFVRSEEGTRALRIDSGSWVMIGGPELRVADARGRVLLYDGSKAAPTALPEGWRAVPGAIDATLSFDGEHVLSWSSRLKPTHPDGEPIVLAQPRAGEGPAWWAFDTDGSVLVATGYDPSVVYDCPLSSQPCERIGEVSGRHGDPMFIGADM